MISSLNKFIDSMEKLEKYIFGIKLQNNLLCDSQQGMKNLQTNDKFQKFKKHYENFRIKKIFEYNTIVISIYGYLERYIEDIIKEYLAIVNKIFKYYNDLPDAIKENHYDLSSQLIQNLKLSKYKSITSENIIIKNLYLCSINDENYKINLDAYTQHTANFRQEEIKRFFSLVGVNNISHLIKHQPRFVDYLKSNRPEVDISQTRDEIIYNVINDIAERRNEVSHGAIHEIVSKEILEDYIGFLKIYGKSLYDVLKCEILEYESEHIAKILNKTIKIYDNQIVIFELDKPKISVGDRIIAKKNSMFPKYIDGKIKELQINGENYNKISESEKIKIGMKVDFKVKDNYQLYLISQN